MELLQLRYFRTAAQLENFTKTADYYMLPQSAISRTIHKLETELDCELFTRHGKKISLNENGKQFLAKIDLALNSIDAGIEALKQQELKLIGIEIQSGVRFITPLVQAFEASHPDCKIVFYQSETSAVLGKEADFTFFQLPIDEALYAHEILMKDEIMVAVHLQSKWAKHKLLALESLKEEPFIAYPTGNQLRSFTEHLCLEHGFNQKVIFEANDVTVFRSMIEAHAGLAMVPASSWNLTTNKNVKLIPLKNHPTRTLVIAWKRENEIPSYRQEFLNFTREWFTQLLSRQ